MVVPDAGVAQLVERNLAKVEVESSRLFSRSRYREASLLVSLRRITGRCGIVKVFLGEVAKRLCSGLQSRLDGFDSRPRLQISPVGQRFTTGSVRLHTT